MAESLVLRSGFAPWLRRAPMLLALAAATSLATAGARPGWTAIAIIALLAALHCVRLQSDPPCCRGRLHLAEDGAGVLFTAEGSRPVHQSDGAWVSRWLCVLPLRDTGSGRRLQCVVCASLNRADSYRRLLRGLRAEAWRPAGEGKS